MINSLSEILNFYDNNQEYVNKTFEMDEKFLLKFYLENRTTAVGKIYSSLNSKKNHLESMCCELCQEKRLRGLRRLRGFRRWRFFPNSKE